MDYIASNMAKGIAEILDILPNTDLQLDRIECRHRHHCPKCGDIVASRYHKAINKPLDCSDIIIQCGKCGDSVIKRRRRSGKVVCIDGDTKAPYSDEPYLQELKAAMESADPQDLHNYADLCERYADELRMVSDNDEDVYYKPYVKEMSAMLQDIERNGSKNLQFICERTFKCNDIAKKELLDVMRDIYEYACCVSSDLPDELFSAISLERQVLEHSYDSMFSDSDFYIDSLTDVAEDFETIPYEDRTTYPYVSTYAHKYIYQALRRYLYSDEDMEEAATMMLEYARNARMHGAPVNREVVEICTDSYAILMLGGKDVHKDMLGDNDLWDNDPYYVALSSSLRAGQIYSDASEDAIAVTLDSFDEDALNEIKELSSRVIELTEEMTELGGLAKWLPQMYFMNGLVTEDVKKMRIAYNYADLFHEAGLIDYPEAEFVMTRIVNATRVGDPLQRAALNWLGYPT